MANVKAKGSSPLKIAGGAILLVSSVSLMIHRMPHRGYVEIHEDKPRPTTAGADAMPAPAPVAVQPVAAAPLRSPSMPAGRAPVIEHASVAPPTETPHVAVVETVDLEYECRSEAAILCYKMPARGLPRCLREYDDALMRPCRHALKSGRYALPAEDEESDSGE